ncbi:glutaredoxin family protein [Acidovorax sp. PRC11]|uniref:glutaredoxin family protein n=1 Tax=Acidovorax sp. PRC11 TaxID=2962592 RepID=UPI002882C5CC|nr:glutaredoxin family protein [Acidovorax sp. PRC11]MDT0138536.1 glutaredoxin family protein [Acidovorax sp. PRC11]
MTSVPFAARLAALCAVACAAAALPAAAQTVYRIVGPDGKVTFSDRAPDAQTAPDIANGRRSAGAGGSSLPYELQQIATRFPVVLYTGSDCAPCASARNLLVGRGVPFTERTVSTNEDIDALQRLSGSTSLPFGTIGSQQLSGYSDTEWAQYLDAAGYPRQSQLPPTYRRPPPTPLVAAKPASAPVAAAARAPAPAPAPASAPGPAPGARTPANPAGIQF